jgi:hypothetical protein
MTHVLIDSSAVHTYNYPSPLPPPIAVTLLGAALALALFFTEWRRCMTARLNQEMHVDDARGGTLHLNFNLTFPALPCQALRVQVGDVSGKNQGEAGLKMAQ